MAAKGSAAVFHVGAGAKTVSEVGKPELTADYASLTPLTVAGETYLLGYHPDAATFDVYGFDGKHGGLKPVKAKPHVGKAQDIVNVFTRGNQPYVCMYAAKKGIFETYAVGDDLTFSPKPYRFYRNHELAVSHGFTTLKPFTQYGQVAGFLGYREDTGYVAIYTVSVAVASAPGVPPLLMLPVWAHPWAAGWTRFAFFSLGGVPFFLKTNVKALNVNIDHVLDTLPNGTAEIGTELQDQLPDALKLTNVEPFTLAHGEPYFVTYLAGTGAATLNRFHADCLGWSKLAEFKAPAHAKVVTPVQAGDQAYLIFA
jgi:hypothetical protein